MIIKVPLRISFIGGGTDIAPAFLETPGVVISATFDKYVYIGEQNKVPNVEAFQDMKSYVASFYNKATDYFPQYGTPFGWPKLNIASEIVPGSGLGTSSAIAVGLMFWLYNDYFIKNERYINLRASSPTWNDLAKIAVIFEREHCKISGGIQDQFIAAFPGLTKLIMSGDLIDNQKSNTSYNNIKLNVEIIPYHHHDVNIKEFSKHLLLVDTGIIRRQSNIMSQQINATSKHELTKPLEEINSLTHSFENHLLKSNWYELGKIISESWEWKKQLNAHINIPEVDQILEDAKYPLSYGGKLLGAGAGGFVFLICEDRNETNFHLTSKGYRTIKPNIVNEWIIKE